MAYVTSEDFAAYSPSTVIPSDEFAEIAERASDIVDMVSMYRIGNEGGFDALSVSTQAKVKKATCAEIQTMYANGGADVVTGSGEEPQSVTLGKFSYSTGGSSAQTLFGVVISPLIRLYLQGTGLLYRGINYSTPVDIGGGIV